MNDLEISKALALAIGWEPEQMRVNADGILMLQASDAHFARPFSYRDWNVIGPIAAKHNCFPTLMGYGLWSASIAFGKIYDEDTPQKAIALAVIQGAKK